MQKEYRFFIFLQEPMSNTTGQPIVVERITSPQFETVEVHETRIESGVARMRELSQLVIPPRSSVVLDEGGTHLMLMNPLGAGLDERTVVLHLHYDNAGIVMVSADMRQRVVSERSR